MTPDRPLVLVLGIIVGVLALTRATRLVVDDDYPPVVKLRESYIRRVGESWGQLVECPWCTAPYLAIPAVAWFASLVAWPSAAWNVWAWWLVNSWAAASWVAAFLCLRDIPPESR